ncbi:AAA family ATPase [Clostridium saccharobutylicum]|uniref:DNA replication and repair protein RecF n=1 Tax=Clostridium saccharobutylicum TaxID=169679 RepID=A0A1S8NI31_CLOSA|nr:AAA family ATPase [Clostridium saccharobutylicum]OOM15921.1 DNA replication and repair protein RecF [Clostridium saccharobutylicum]
MNIKRVNIKNFTVFDDFELNLSSGINIIIGKNGTGKTHLLKGLYTVCDSINNETKYTSTYQNLISQLYFKVNPFDLVRDKSKKDKIISSVSITYSEKSYSRYLIIKVGENQLAEDGSMHKEVDFHINNIFIPATEILSHSKGFLALNNKYDMPFDKTYVDIITNAELPESKNISEIDKKILNIISKVINGEVVYENDNFYIVKKDGSKIDFSIEAEGIRKFALLWKLIRNGLIDNETILFWDEPEANINPELMPILVDILIELQRCNVQVFLATHSYNFAKYFEVKRNSNDKVLFHSLYKVEQGIKCQSEENFGDLKNNSIIEADTKLLDEVIEGNFEE